MTTAESANETLALAERLAQLPEEDRELGGLLITRLESASGKIKRPRRSARGIWKRLHTSAAEIEQARSEMCGKYR